MDEVRIILNGIQNVMQFRSTRVNLQKLPTKEQNVTGIFAITGRFSFHTATLS